MFQLYSKYVCNLLQAASIFFKDIFHASTCHLLRLRFALQCGALGTVVWPAAAATAAGAATTETPSLGHSCSTAGDGRCGFGGSSAR